MSYADLERRCQEAVAACKAEDRTKKHDAFYERALGDILGGLIDNGTTSGTVDQLKLAIRQHIEVQTLQAALDFFYSGELTFVRLPNGNITWDLKETA